MDHHPRRRAAARDELLLKVLLAVEEGPDHALEVITEHRTALTRLLQQHRRTLARRRRPRLPSLVAEALVARAEADLRWLDTCEARVLRARATTAHHERRHRWLSPPPAPPAALELEAVVKRYGAGLAEVRALTDVSLRVEPGQLVAVMGPSGCGKSTMLHLAGALEDPDAGHVLVGGRDLSTLGSRERAALRRTDVGFVFQRLNLVPSLTAMENVMLPLELEGVGRREAPRGRPARRSCPSASTSSSTASPTTSPAASSSASRSPAPSSAPAS